MLIGGFQKFSLIDYPHKIAALIFTQGCNFLCPFCHNPNLVIKNQYSPPLAENTILSFLKKRINQLNAVVITGGEPTLQKDLMEFIKKIKDLNFLVKLDTNGTNPKILKEILKNNLIDYIAMDIKAPLEKYFLLTQKKINVSHIKESIQLILNSNIDYEFRTTLIQNLHIFEDVEKMARLIYGANKYFLQKFISNVVLNPDLKNYSPFSDDILNQLKDISLKYVKNCFIRR